LPDELYLCIDAGTSVIKVSALDLSGREVAHAERRNELTQARDGTAIQDMAGTWSKTAACLREIGEKLDRLPARVAALAVTGQGDGTWLIDGDGQPVGPALTWLDGRARDVVARLRATPASDLFYRSTGCGLVSSIQSTQLAWLQEASPETLARAETAFHCKDWLFYKLAGQRVTDVTEGCINFGDIRSRTYNEEIFEALGIGRQRHLVPEMVDGTRFMQPLVGTAATECGLREGTPVVLASQDVVCAGIGAGLLVQDRAVACSIFGSTGIHMIPEMDAGDLTFDGEPSGHVHLVPGTSAGFRLETHLAATLNFDWVVALIESAVAAMGYPTREESAGTVLDRVLDAETRHTALYHPYIHPSGERGPFVDANARASFNDLTLETRFPDLVRGVVEGLALAARDCYAKLDAQPSLIRIEGGGANSAHLRQALADALQTDVESAARAPGPLGAACIAAVAIGAAADLDAAARAFGLDEPAGGELTRPDPARSAYYRQRYLAFRETRHAMAGAWALLNG